jgi:glutathione S-transferase
MDHEVAERFKEMSEHSREHYASKAEMAVEFGKVQVALANLRTEMLTGDARIEASVSKLETQMHKLEARLIRWFVGTAIAIAGLTFAIARYVA